MAKARTPKGRSARDSAGGAGGDLVIENVAPFCVPPGRPIREVLALIDRNGEGLALVVDEARRLLGTVTDGDVRRAILAGVDLNDTIGALLKSKRRGSNRPVTAPYGTPAIHLLRLMGEHVVRHVPLIDGAGRVVAVGLLSRVVRGADLPLQAVIMAGGFGTRLRPLTDALPKPMLPLGGQPLLQRTVRQLGQAGVRNINIITHYKADKIKEHFGDGRSFGAKVRYSHEAEPLGTVGGLRLMDFDRRDPLLVINGDVLTTVNVAAMLDYHREHEAHLTVGVRHYAMTVPYGVVECRGVQVCAIREKPESVLLVNAGVYLVELEVCEEIPTNRRFDMTDLIELLIAQGRRVISFPIHEYWLDIGQLEDYERAQQDIDAGELNC